MKEYIERAQLLKNLGYDEKRRADVLPGSTFDIVLKEPAADVAEVRHGRWIFDPGKIPYCSECKEYSDDGDKGATFCPWCGARMGKEDEHEAS
nr:MAG TPA: 50S ribosomal protein L2 [Caudoviricetes sp.]